MNCLSVLFSLVVLRNVVVHSIVMKLSLAVLAACLHEWSCFRAYCGTFARSRCQNALPHAQLCAINVNYASPRSLVKRRPYDITLI